MQPPAVAPAPAMAPAPIAAPAPLTGSTAPDRTMVIHTGLIVTALLFALLGMMGNTWLILDSDKEEEFHEAGAGLTLSWSTIETGSADNCSALLETLDFMAGDDDPTEMKCDGKNLEITASFSDLCDAEGDDYEDDCDRASAGFTGTLFIILGILVLIATLAATFLRLRGTTLPFSQYYPFCGTASILIGVVAWYLMMPDPPEGLDPILGSNAWMTIASSAFAAGAGGLMMYQGSVTTSATGPKLSARLPGIGARTLTADAEAREFVLRETAMGNQTLSIVEDGHLFRVTRANRDDTGTHSEDLFMTRMDALCGFTHARFDWLDTSRYLWNAMSVIGLLLTILAFENPSLIFYTNWFILMFAVGTILSMLQFADPELITFETSTGKHRMLIYRAGSNRQLTNASMEIIDSAMRDALRGEEIDPTALNAVADAIESEMAEARRAHEEAEAAAEAARLQAQALAQAQAEHQAQMQAQALEQARAQVAAANPAPPAVAPPPVAMAPTAPPVAPAPAPIPPVMNPPAPAAPAFTPAPPPPVPAPATPAPPPPAPLPPPGGAGAPLPPPPLSMDMGVLTEEITAPPEIPMQAAPRDDSLSEGEKENILSELGDD